MKYLRLDVVVFLAAAVLISWNLGQTGIASGDIDPIQHFGAQDEATYTREAIEMVRGGDWMTPSFLGRPIFEKPPLLMWLSALAMKIFGISPWSARLPSALAGALVCTLCFGLVRSRSSVSAGLAAASLAAGSQILFTMARHNMTDILLAASTLSAVAVLARDPGLRRPMSLFLFAAATAAGILTKSAAGALTLPVLLVVTGLGERSYFRAVAAGLLSLALAAPWFVYSLFAHHDWFLADTLFQLVTIGSAAHQTSRENHVWFYALRLITSDPVLLLFVLAALPRLVKEVRIMNPAALLATSYCVTFLAALLLFRFSSQQYLCWFIPSLILIAGWYSPWMRGRSALAVVAIAGVLFAVKAVSPDQSFGVMIHPGTTLAAAIVLQRYCEERRTADLYVLGVDDEFLSGVLPLYRVHYGWVDASDSVAREHPHLVHLGVLIPARELSLLPGKMPIYRDRLHAWGWGSTQPVASGISARDSGELQRIVFDHPESDFLVSPAILPDPKISIAHRLAATGSGFFLLESQRTVETATPAWTCSM